MGLYDDQSPLERRRRYDKLRMALIQTRQGGGWDGHMQEIATYLYPRRFRATSSDTNRYGKTNSSILDSSGKFAAKTLQSGLHAGITSPARPWFKLSTPDPDLAENPPVKEWLHLVTQRMYAVFAGSNIYNGLHSLYLDFGLFGTSPLHVLDDEEDLLRAYNYAAGTYAIGLDRRMRANQFVRTYRLTVRQMVEEFGIVSSGGIDWTRFSNPVRTAWDKGDYETSFEIANLVKPNDYADSRKPWSKNLPFSSCYWELGVEDKDSATGSFLRETGYHEFPIMCPRWEVTGEDSMATDSPGQTAIGDVKQLQTMVRRKGQLVEKAVDPPLKGPASLRTQKVSLVSGDITYVDGADAQKGFGPLHEVRLEGYQHLVADTEEMRFLIRRAFFEDLFLMLAQSENRGAQPVTAREIEERHEEKLIALGPVLERTNDELLNPLIDRTFNVMKRNGLIPPPPPDVQGVKLKVEYISILAQAQKLVGVAALDRFVTTILAIAPVEPNVLHKVDFDQIIENYQEALGTDPRTIRSTEEASQRAAQAGQLEQAAVAAKTAKDAATAASVAGRDPVAQGSVLDAMLSGGAGGGPAPAAIAPSAVGA